ncbi:MAG: hypothetical protein ACFFEF_17450 [Candidatus Thorarchaeota archaeon]
MAYEEDIPRPRGVMISDDVCKYLVVIITLLMLLIALPSILTQTYDNPLPGIVALGFAALVLVLLYLALQIGKLTRLQSME